MRSCTLLFLLLCSLSGFSQTSINNFKYVVVPEKFGFLREVGQYGLNNLTKSLLEENGFSAWFDNAELPAEIANNRCGALYADVVERKSMFVSRLTLLLKDCKGNVIFKSKEGNSREKDYGLSYTLALRDAFTSLADAKYVYQPLPASAVQSPASAAQSPASPVQSSASAARPTTPVTASDNAPAAANTVAVPAASTAGVLYAQPIANGYQLIDTTPKTVLRIFRSSAPDYFIADNGSSNGIVFKRADNWIFEYYKDGKLMAEKLMIKF